MTQAGGEMGDGELAEVRRWCVEYLSRVTKQPTARIAPEAEFASLGLDSAEMLFMVSALEDRFGLDLPSDTTTEHPSVERLSRFVAGALAGKRGA